MDPNKVLVRVTGRKDVIEIVHRDHYRTGTALPFRSASRERWVQVFGFGRRCGAAWRDERGPDYSPEVHTNADWRAEGLCTNAHFPCGESLFFQPLTARLFEDAEFREETVQLTADDLLVIFSDGISEATNDQDEEFGDTRIIDCVSVRSAIPTPCSTG